MSGDRDAVGGGTVVSAGPFVIETDDPCLDGHFPGDPLVPAVVILDMATHALEDAAVAGNTHLLAHGSRVAGIAHAKFSSPLRPREPLTIDYRANADGSIGFRCHSSSRAVADGAFVIGSTERLR